MTKTIDDVCACLRTQVNNVLRRLGMYGDEFSLILLFDALAYAENIQDAWAQRNRVIRSSTARRGGCRAKQTVASGITTRRP